MKKIVNHIVGGVLVFGLMGVPLCLASELTVPNQFSSGDVTSASDVNANFAAIEAAVNDNHARIQEGLQSQSRPVFVGYSEVVEGFSGLNNWQLACHNVSAGSHVCTDTELLEAPYNPDAPLNDGVAWINKDLSSKGEGTGSISRYESCHNSSEGHIYNGGRMGQVGTCHNAFLPVACCK